MPLDLYDLLEEARVLADSNDLTSALGLVSLRNDEDPRYSGIIQLQQVMLKLAHEGDLIARVGKAQLAIRGEEVDHEKPLPRGTRKLLQPISQNLDGLVYELMGYKLDARKRITNDAMMELFSLNESTTGPRPGGLIELLMQARDSAE